MPVYDYRCESCWFVTERELRLDEVSESLMLPCSCAGVDDAGVGLDTPHKRDYRSGFGLGTVQGAGGSPGRFGSSKRG